MRFKLPAVSWALFDFAQTIFSMNIVSLYFVLWVTVEKGKQDIYYSVALAASLIFAAFLEVFLGTLSDIIGKKKIFLLFFTISCAVFTAALSLANRVITALAVFALANCAFQVATVFYNTFLPSVSRKERMGELSGFGVALGYVGAMFGIAATRPFVLRWGYNAAFLPTAALFLIFSVPCLFFVKEQEQSDRSVSWPGLMSVKERIKKTFSPVKGSPQLVRFLIAAFIFCNAVNTVIIFMAVFIKQVFELTDSQLISLFVVLQVFAVMGSFAAGILSDRVGPKKTLLGALSCWLVALFSASIITNEILLWVIGPVAAVALGSTWAASRVMAIKLCPPDKLGEVLGLFGVVGKFSAVIGPLVWGLTIFSLDFMGAAKYRVAVFIQAIFIIAGGLVLLKTRESAVSKG